MQKEIKKEQMQITSVYAVQYTIDTRKYVGRNGRQRGLVMTNSSGKIFRTWNMQKPDAWVVGEMELYKKHRIFPATEIETQFAWNTLERDSYHQRLLSTAQKLAEAMKRLTYFETDKWHKVAERVNQAFGKGEQSNESK